MKDKFLEFAKTPVGTAIAIGLFVLVCIIYIVSKSKFGKKVLLAIESKVNSLLDGFKKHKEETEKSIKEQKEFYEKKYLETKQDLCELEQFVVGALKIINNKKLQEAIKSFELGKISTESEKVAK